MYDVDKIICLTEEISILKSRFKSNAGMGNINTAIGVLEFRVKELAQKIRDDSKDGQTRSH